MEKLSSAVRPLATIAFVAGFLLYAHYDRGAFDAIKDTAIMVVAYWFGTRTPAKPSEPSS